MAVSFKSVNFMAAEASDQNCVFYGNHDRIDPRDQVDTQTAAAQLLAADKTRKFTLISSAIEDCLCSNMSLREIETVLRDGNSYTTLIVQRRNEDITPVLTIGLPVTKAKGIEKAERSMKEELLAVVEKTHLLVLYIRRHQMDPKGAREYRAHDQYQTNLRELDDTGFLYSTKDVQLVRRFVTKLDTNGSNRPLSSPPTSPRAASSAASPRARSSSMKEAG